MQSDNACLVAVKIIRVLALLMAFLADRTSRAGLFSLSKHFSIVAWIVQAWQCQDEMRCYPLTAGLDKGCTYSVWQHQGTSWGSPDRCHYLLRNWQAETRGDFWGSPCLVGSGKRHVLAFAYLQRGRRGMCHSLLPIAMHGQNQENAVHVAMSWLYQCWIWLLEFWHLERLWLQHH